MGSIAIIPARGGSKRIPRKNIRPFLGKPIITYVIDAAIQSGLFDEVMVSTDDAEIAAVAEQYGAMVPFFRSAKNADDHASTIDVLLEVLDNYAAQNRRFDHLCCLYPTAPFVTGDLLKRAFQALTDKQADIIYPLQRFDFPIQRAFFLRDGLIQWADPDNYLKRSQDLEPAYHDAGQFYWFGAQALTTHRNLQKLRAGGIEINQMQAHDIDTEEDWQMAELKYQLLYKHPGRTL
ncbi:pseudaminic acid cytidylyltransferase [Arsenicibacter rosenii]|uniref:Pseudaminic acid cytidylyltransferase n=1 Tax=Arsenicibacter rosenii TaxID=1750698 RepID=A0A1S2VI47_9BACT|nr:pseudaminic acid cytidylyltransferase [Arsenicibacter rosenii]OIN57915.1 pseudaminic acid cytidylyltransferase [Arsenicibacter rosenii]